MPSRREVLEQLKRDEFLGFPRLRRVHPGLHAFAPVRAEQQGRGESARWRSRGAPHLKNISSECHSSASRSGWLTGSPGIQIFLSL